MAKVRTSERTGPGLLFVLIALVIVAVVAAKFLGFAPGGEKAPAPGGIEAPKGEMPEAPAKPKLPSVLIYHTHTSENYSPSESHTRGAPGDIVKVGQELARCLEDRGVKAIHVTKIHDFPKYEEAYSNSQNTVTSILDSNPNIQIVLDLHRDGLPPTRPDGYTTARIQGEDVAKILFVVGDVANPRAEENVAFAEKLRVKMEELYPGLSRGVKVQHGNFNGQLHPNSVVVFVGDYRDNTLSEALRGVKYLADVIAAVLAAKPAGTTAEQFTAGEGI